MGELSDYEARFSGMGRLVGRSGLDRLRQAHVCVVGVGGVGSWTVEALARSGIGRLTMVDLDEICVSNVNRQLPALTREIGRSKVQVLKERVREINPACEANAVEEFFTSASAERLLAETYDYLVDAIDALENKCLLIALCRQKGVPVLTIGSAGGRQDPTAIRVADLAFSTHDRLLSSARRVLRADYGFPRTESTPFGIPSIYSKELPVFPQPDGTVCHQKAKGTEARLNCNGGYGSATYVTGTFGFAAAAEVVRALAAGSAKNTPSGL